MAFIPSRIKKHDTNPGKVRLNLTSMMDMFTIILVFLLFFQEQSNTFFPDYSPLIQFFSQGLILILVTVMSYAFLITNMPWFARKDWDSEFQDQSA